MTVFFFSKQLHIHKIRVCVHIFIVYTIKSISLTIYAVLLAVHLIGGNGSLIGSGYVSLTLWVSVCVCVHVCVCVCVCLRA